MKNFITFPNGSTNYISKLVVLRIDSGKGWWFSSDRLAEMILGNSELAGEEISTGGS